MVEFRVLRCAHCQTFQVLQVTKSPKWKCKLCGEKQSVLKEYGRGTGADCRRHVQKLNIMRMEIDTAAEKNRFGSACYESASSVSNSGHAENGDQEYLFTEQKKSSHWEAFLDEDKRDENEDYKSAINVKSEGGVCDDYGGMDEDGIRVTTDWSAYQNERKQIWRNKRKLDHNRSKWNKSAKYGDDSIETCISVNNSHGRKSCPYTTDKRFEPTWKQNRYNAPDSQNHFSKGVDSQIRSVPCLSAQSTMKNLALPSASTSYNGSNYSFCVSNNDLKGHNDNDTDSEQESFFKKLRFDSESRMSSGVSSSDGRKKSTSSSKSSALPIQSSKWSTFITEKCDDDSNSNDDSDNEAAFQNFTNKFNSDNASDSLKPLPNKGSSNSYVPNPMSKWNTFVDEKNSDLDDDVVNEDNYDSCNVNRKYSESICSNKISKSDLNDQVSGIYDNESKNFESFSQSVINGINDYAEKRVKYEGSYRRSITESIEPLSQAKMGNIEKQSSLFQIGDDDDIGAWDLDL